MSFQVGDIVQCIDARGSQRITYGYHYTVSEIDGEISYSIHTGVLGPGIYLTEIVTVPPFTSFCQSRFRKVGIAHDERTLLAQLKQPVTT